MDLWPRTYVGRAAADDAMHFAVTAACDKRLRRQKVVTIHAFGARVCCNRILRLPTRVHVAAHPEDAVAARFEGGDLPHRQEGSGSAATYHQVERGAAAVECIAAEREEPASKTRLSTSAADSHSDGGDCVFEQLPDSFAGRSGKRRAHRATEGAEIMGKTARQQAGQLAIVRSAAEQKGGGEGRAHRGDD